MAATPQPPVSGEQRSGSPFGVGYAILGFFVAFFGAQVLGGVVVAAAIGILLATGILSLPEPSDPQGWLGLLTHPIPLLLAAVASSASFVGTAWGTCAVARKPARQVLALQAAPLVTCGAALLGIFALGLLVDEVVHAFQDLLPGLSFGALEGFENAAKAGGLLMRVFAVTSMAIVPGICEEVFFRGFLQRSFVARWGAPVGIAVTSVAFGAVHLDPPQALGAAITGLYLGWVAYRAGSVLPSIVAHIANNAFAYIGANLASMQQLAASRQHYPPVLLAAAGLGTAAAILIVARSAPLPKN